MEIIIHRINKIDELRKINKKNGVEIDIRSFGSELILNHGPFIQGDRLEDYLDEYNHGTLVLNIKEAGIEENVISLIKMRPKIKSYFLLDVEFPYLYNSSIKGNKNLAVRFSEFESIRTVEKFINKIDWVWIDTFSTLPITKKNKNILNGFKKCIVCPERWGREEDINKYKIQIKKLNIHIDAVMTSFKTVQTWIE